MKITGTSNPLSADLYDPFVHFSNNSESGYAYVEVMVNIKTNEEFQNISVRELEDIVMVVVNIDCKEGAAGQNVEGKDNNIVYTGKIPLPSKMKADSRVIVMVVHGDPEEGGTVIVRYGDID
jgi:hypothetical protein